MKKIICIPARLASSRIGSKPLIKIGGKTIVEHAVESALGSSCDSVVVFTDSDEVIDLVRRKYSVIYRPFYSCRKIRTYPCQVLTDSCVTVFRSTEEYSNGTDRIAGGLEASPLLLADNDIIMNLQCDMVGVDPDLLDKLLAATEALSVSLSNNFLCVTAARAPRHRELINPDRVKVSWDADAGAVFSRKSKYEDWQEQVLRDTGEDMIVNSALAPEFIHIGIYCFDYRSLRLYSSLGICAEEVEEGLEQLRIIHGKYKRREFQPHPCGRDITVLRWNGPSPAAIDSPCDEDAAKNRKGCL
jgi:3-deoxy-manno-octulosonate cytidylyltransferase (CMP-KDO synthetase)